MTLKDIKIAAIEIVSFSTNDFVPADEKLSISLDAKIGFEFLQNDKLLNILFTLKINGSSEHKKGKDEIGSIETVFGFFIPDWDEIITKAEDKFIIDPQIENSLIDAVYSGTRGMLVVKAADSFLGKLYLPFIDLDMIKPAKKDKVKK